MPYLQGKYSIMDPDSMSRPLYLDAAATTPIDPEVEKVMLHYMREEFGNAGSRTHEYGAKAKQAVQKARDQVADVVAAKRDEVVFTSGATESNNLAILGLRKHAEATGKKHIVATAIEHKAVLDPLEHLRDEYGFEIDLVRPDLSGAVSSAEVVSKVREDTLLVSVMHVNNETGIIQPIEEIAALLKDSDVFFHVDAAQSFGKLIEPLQNPRIDMISISGHKICGPKGIGALVTRRRRYRRLPLAPLVFGGGQEWGLRSGTLPVFLLAALGHAAKIAKRDLRKRFEAYDKTRVAVRKLIQDFDVTPVGDDSKRLPCFSNLVFDGMDSEAVILLLKEQMAISNGSACTSSEYKGSHVLAAMGFEDGVSSVRISWSH